MAVAVVAIAVVDPLPSLLKVLGVLSGHVAVVVKTQPRQLLLDASWR